MSTTPDASQRADDEIVTHLSHWLTRQLGNDELRRKLEEIGTDELPPAGREMVKELVAEPETPERSRGTRHLRGTSVTVAATHTEV
jgi:hypothetical protein